MKDGPLSGPTVISDERKFQSASMVTSTLHSPRSIQIPAKCCRLAALKHYDKDLRVMIAKGTVFPDITASEEKQDKFIASLIPFMSTHVFDGIDLDWEYPIADDPNGKLEDFQNFPKFMASDRNLHHFDFEALEKHVPFFNIM
ncbi:Chitinase II [Penicillium robsamsonii]|uniref:Chitinase II n=1 Tax=Penicillium robsamsonii TaxID=1792511 RepID=UPI002546FDA3|nr:Chitinase II [Penicillium robsamsonii]KAJ5835684.1 Chitinase II [Penicillium robsamsonii]